jgi:hypothetical protein
MEDMARAVFLGLMIASSLTDKISILMAVSMCGFSLAMIIGAIYMRRSPDPKKDESDPKN